MYLHDRLMDLSQKTECMDVILHNEFKNDYPYRENLHDVTFLIGELIDILQQSTLTYDDLIQLEQQYNERYDSKIKQEKKDNEIIW